MLNINRDTYSTTLYQSLSAAFCILVVLSNIVSIKMVKLPFFYNVNLPAGAIIYPLTFLLSDLVTEIFGQKRAKFMVYLALAMNLLTVCIIQLVLALPAAHEEGEMAFKAVMGLTGLRIFASLTAFVVGQLVDIQLYAWIKNVTGPRFLWLRNNGSTCTSQFVDTVLVDLLYLYCGLGMTMKEVMPIILIAYALKVVVTVASTPLFYLSLFLANLGKKEKGMIYESIM